MGIMVTETQRVSIDAPFTEVVGDLADPRNLPEWATEFFRGAATPSAVDGEVRVEVPVMGGPARMRIEAAADVGVVDLFLAAGDGPYGPPVPIRVVPNGDGADVLFTLARFPGTPDAAWQAGLASMDRELGNLKVRLEGRARA